MRQWDNFGDKIDSKRNGWAGPHLDCVVSNVSNGATGKLRGVLFWPSCGANQPDLCLHVFPMGQLSILSHLYQFSPGLGVWGAWMGL